MNRKLLTETLSVSGQLALHDFMDLARSGVKLVINNRPDGETPGQPTAGESKQAALRAGLAYSHIPVSFATLSADEIDRFGKAVAESSGPVHAHCASGARSANVWALSQIRRGAMTRGDAIDWAEKHQVDLRPGLAWLDRQQD